MIYEIITEEDKSYMYYGINFQAVKCACYQNRVNSEPPKNYISESFKIFSENGLKYVRIPIYWESYEKDQKEFNQELDTISNEADRNNVFCIYCNHQWKCSSYLGYGIGFPNSLIKPYFDKDKEKLSSLDPPDLRNLKKFWDRWWDKKLITEDGREGWVAQLEYFKEVINKVKYKKSTFGFEILNEPQVFRQKDFKIIAEYHDYFFKNIEQLTDKTLFFCYTSSGSLLNATNFPWQQVKIKPAIHISNKIVFDIHPYPPSCLFLIYYKILSKLLQNIPLIAGEYNSSIGKNTIISFKRHKRYLDRLKRFSILGGLFWQWSYVKDNQHPSFNLTETSGEKIYPNDNFKNFIAAINKNKNKISNKNNT